MTFSNFSQPAKLAAVGTWLAIGAGLWTLVASMVFLLGTGFVSQFHHPYYQWWLFLPYAGTHPGLTFWLLVGGGIASLSVLGVPVVWFVTRSKDPDLPRPMA